MTEMLNPSLVRLGMTRCVMFTIVSKILVTRFADCSVCFHKLGWLASFANAHKRRADASYYGTGERA